MAWERQHISTNSARILCLDDRAACSFVTRKHQHSITNFLNALKSTFHYLICFFPQLQDIRSNRGTAYVLI